MKNLKCPKCGSTNIHKGVDYASIKLEGESVQAPHINPNECREENCHHQWSTEK